ncbi:hypothetical protein [Spiroplasma tabanidicola]|uniref:Uncharacterized protein n=1 Tax=Spiroplasma tabanidicola TaxID=324079 RepID=A0A6I6CCG8_9MOLU|nr:hypothetical protein [Spiroplasma tabanidicola]QGS51968.1 hypothetical protein STABA_v1c06050 [Spiroplasma tabanidicola]
MINFLSNKVDRQVLFDVILKLGKYDYAINLAINPTDLRLIELIYSTLISEVNQSDKSIS